MRRIFRREGKGSAVYDGIIKHVIIFFNCRGKGASGNRSTFFYHIKLFRAVNRLSVCVGKRLTNNGTGFKLIRVDKFHFIIRGPAKQGSLGTKDLKAKINEQNNALSEIKTKYETLNQENIDKLQAENDTIKDKHSKLIVENENLKTKFVNIKTENENLKTKYSSIKEENKNLKTKCSNMKEEHSSIKESYDSISAKYDHLKQENLNTKTSYAEIYEINENLEKDYDSLLDEYNDLVDKFNDLQDELYNIKSHQTRDDYIASKVKEFMLTRS